MRGVVVTSSLLDAAGEREHDAGHGCVTERGGGATEGERGVVSAARRVENLREKKARWTRGRRLHRCRRGCRRVLDFAQGSEAQLREEHADAAPIFHGEWEGDLRLQEALHLAPVPSDDRVAPRVPESREIGGIGLTRRRDQFARLVAAAELHLQLGGRAQEVRGMCPRRRLGKGTQQRDPVSLHFGGPAYQRIGLLAGLSMADSAPCGSGACVRRRDRRSRDAG